VKDTRVSHMRKRNFTRDFCRLNA